MNDWNQDGKINSSDSFVDYMIYKEVTGDKKQKKEGCYIATCVYGAYDCAEVLCLRHFRDERLSRSATGRQFIRIYYAVSPILVRRFGDKAWFHRVWKGIIDPVVERLGVGE